MIRIFQVGFSKAGTTSLHHLFEDAGLSSIHWEDGKLAENIQDNMVNQRPAVAGYDDIQCFTEMSFVTAERYIDPGRRFDVLHAQYPDALFILNTRNVDDWVRSRTNHYNKNFPEGQKTMRERYALALGLTWDEVENYWRAGWHTHHVDCRAYFADNPRFVEWHIGREGEDEKLLAFLRSHIAADWPSTISWKNKGKHS